MSGTDGRWYALDDPDLPPEFAHLAPDAPSQVCSICARCTWDVEEFGHVCGMTQPDGTSCPGLFREGESAIKRLRLVLAEYDSAPREATAFRASLRGDIIEAARAVADEYNESIEQAYVRGLGDA